MSTSKEIPELYFDGPYIDVLWDNHDPAVKWLETYFGWKVLRQEDWKVDPRCSQGKMTQMDFGTWLITYLTETRLPHHYAERGTVEPQLRLCFRTRELERLRRTFVTEGVRVSAVYSGPKTRYFDVWATAEGIRLTLQEDLSLPSSDLAPSWVRVGVRRLNESVQWYGQHLGMKCVEHQPAQGYAVMEMKLNRSEEKALWVLEQQSQEAYAGKVDGQVQPVCWIRDRQDFFKYHQYLKQRRIETSGIGGFLTQGWVSFHFYDPDGNRLNISSL
ncbi:VOC family protein [Paenibacillus phocaensis]|uniref:VOC family protein n=1 Tax=Paenibacillus phocaensis TaxID=1776378 RepID=UPI0003AB2F0F|nr:VOC family protein [Paenibacillus phocaensis]